MTDRTLVRRRIVVVALVVPILILVVPLVVVPLIFMVRTTFDPASSGIFGDPNAGALDSYKQVLTQSFYWKSVLTTFLLGAGTTLITLLVGVPCAYWMRLHPGWRPFITACMLAPLTVNIIVRVYGWQLILSEHGPLNWVLREVGLAPVQLLSRWPAILISLVHIMLPFMVLSAYAAMTQLDTNLVDAARTLGASSFKSLLRVVVPASFPGLVAGSAIVFALSAGSFLAPVILGGGRVLTLPVLIYQDSQAGNYALAGCLAILLFILLAPFTVVSRRRS